MIRTGMSVRIHSIPVYTTGIRGLSAHGWEKESEGSYRYE